MPDRRTSSLSARLAAIRSTVRSVSDRVGASEYQRVGESKRFRAAQRPRIRAASRLGLAVVAVAVSVEVIGLLGLQGGQTGVALALNGATLTLVLVGWWLLSRTFRRFPEPVVWLVTLGLALSTAATGLTVPALAVQSAGYLLVIPGLVALVLPWRTVTHVRWLLAYAVVAVAYFVVDPNETFTAAERGGLVVVLLVALCTSLAGHVLLQRAQIRGYAQLERIRGLQRGAAAAQVELEQTRHALELTARTDALTGAGNRRRLEEDLRAVRAHIDRSNFVYGLAEIDLDRFKAINDFEGHAAGDDVLCRVVHGIQKTIRANDAVYRLGGDEFLVILSLPDLEGLAAATERLRAAVIGLDIEHPANQPHGVVSISIGATLIGKSDLTETDEDWLTRVEAALQQAKAGGRNRVQLAEWLTAPDDAGGVLTTA
jgi:diguanylate cyclase (GGDEF)-like protein